jgi:hypothetical protein
VHGACRRELAVLKTQTSSSPRKVSVSPPRYWKKWELGGER